MAVERYEARPADRVDRAGVSMTELPRRICAPRAPHGLGGGRDRTHDGRCRRRGAGCVRRAAGAEPPPHAAVPPARTACARGRRNGARRAPGQSRETSARDRVAADRTAHRGSRPGANRQDSRDRAGAVGVPPRRPLPAELVVVAARARAARARARPGQGPHRRSSSPRSTIRTRTCAPPRSTA